MKKRFKVGIFDSGIGGLTVLHECVRHVPDVTYLYYGDNGRAPYGNRSEEEILRFTREAFDYFRRKKADAVVIACNTATAVAADEMRKEFAFPVIGTEPAIKPAAAVSKNILVLATERTAESPRLKMLTGRFPECNIKVYACSRLAGAIERYLTEGEPFLLSAHLPGGKFDGVVLGCTHYSFFASEIASRYSAPVFDGNKGVAKRLSCLLGAMRSGRDDHFLPTADTNKSLRKNHTKEGKIPIKFVGKERKKNKNVYFQTFVLDKHKK